MKKVLTIAGSDSSGGAGIQADLKTMMAHGVYGMSVITALTAQNTCGVKAVLPVEPDFLACQLDAVFQDIMPDAVKIGMVPSAGAVKVIAEALKKYKARNVVLDPVMLSTSGTTLAGAGAVEAMKTLLFPRCDLITPNIPELANLIMDGDAKEARNGRSNGNLICTQAEMDLVVRVAGNRYGVAILCKGGHLPGHADDVLVQGDKVTWYPGKKIANSNTHGTGCTLSSAIACNLAKGMELAAAVKHGKEYLTSAIAEGLDIGQGHGPLNHLTGGFKW